MATTRARSRHTALTKRERQIMDALYRLGRGTAGEILSLVPGAPSYSTIRTQLRVLEDKGHVRHEDQGLRYLYTPTVPRHAARRTALKHLIDTFFDGSSLNLVTSLLGSDGPKLSDEDLDRIVSLVKSSRGETP
jgi:predicted transcriptional regulator